MIQVHDLAYFIAEFTRIQNDDNIQDPNVKMFVATLLPVCRMLSSVGQIQFEEAQKTAFSSLLDTIPQDAEYPPELGELIPNFFTWFRSL